LYRSSVDASIETCYADGVNASGTSLNAPRNKRCYSTRVEPLHGSNDLTTSIIMRHLIYATCDVFTRLLEKMREVLKTQGF